MREEIGGVIGVRCYGAALTGKEFSAEALERLVEAGGVLRGKPFVVTRVGDVRGEVFRLQAEDAH